MVSRFDVLDRRECVAEGVAVVDLDVVVECSTGTYIRALARDLGATLGTGGHLTALRRLRSGPFGEAEAQILGDEPLRLLGLADAARRCFPSLVVDSAQAVWVRHGRPLPGVRLPAPRTALFDTAGRAARPLHRARWCCATRGGLRLGVGDPGRPGAEYRLCDERTHSGWPGDRLAGSARRLVESASFQNLIVAVIIANAVTLGIQTYAVPGWLHTTLEWADRVFLGIFVVELTLRFAADGFRPQRFFRSGWNVFDFLVVAAAFVPGLAANSTVLRLVRLLRVARLIKMMPDVSVLFDGMRRAAGPAFSLVALTVLLCYLYAVLGVVLFGERMPAYFGNVGEALLTLFTLLTLEGWNSVMYELREVSPAAIPYTISFILVGTYIVINLVVGVVITSLDEAYKKRAQEEAARHDLTETIHELRSALDSLETKLQQSGMLERSTVGAEELEHRVEDHLPHRRSPAQSARPRRTGLRARDRIGTARQRRGDRQLRRGPSRPRRPDPSGAGQ